MLSNSDAGRTDAPGMADLGLRPKPPSLIDPLHWCIRRRKHVMAGVAFGLLVGIAAAFLLPTTYTAKIGLIAPTPVAAPGAAAALSALGGAGSLVGSVTARTPDELYIAIVQSDRVLRALDEQFNLRSRWRAESFTELSQQRERYVRATSDRRSGLLVVEVTDADPAIAASLANAHATEANKVLDSLAVTEAQRRRAFFEQQVKKSETDLVGAENRLRTFQERSRLVAFDKQAELLLQRLAQARARLSERQIHLQVLRTTTTDSNPTTRQVQAEIVALEREVRSLERYSGASSAEASERVSQRVEVAAADLPEAAIEFLRARRDLRTQELIFESLIRQLEAARLDEAREGSRLQLIEPAFAPDRKSGPKRLLVIATTTLAGALLALAIAMAMGWREDLRTGSGAR